MGNLYWRPTLRWGQYKFNFFINDSPVFALSVLMSASYGFVWRNAAEVDEPWAEDWKGEQQGPIQSEDLENY